MERYDDIWRRNARQRLTKLAVTLGGTRVFYVPVVVGKLRHFILVKAEWCNPTASMKVRTAHGLVCDLVDRGRLSGDSVIVESSSGNLALGLAYVCSVINARFVPVVDASVSRMKLMRLRQFTNVEISMVTSLKRDESFLDARLSKVAELQAADARVVWTNQYESMANPLSHYRGTAEELANLAARYDPPDAIFVPVSTGGTYVGVRDRFHDAGYATEVVAVDVVGSRALGKVGGARSFSGIGSSQVSPFIAAGIGGSVNHVILEEAALAPFASIFLRETGLRLGPSSAAVVFAAIEYLRRRETSSRVACIAPDNGGDYLDSLYDQRWLASRNLVPNDPSAVERDYFFGRPDPQEISEQSSGYVNIR